MDFQAVPLWESTWNASIPSFANALLALLQLASMYLDVGLKANAALQTVAKMVNGIWSAAATIPSNPLVTSVGAEMVNTAQE